MVTPFLYSDPTLDPTSHYLPPFRNVCNSVLIPTLTPSHFLSHSRHHEEDIVELLRVEALIQFPKADDHSVKELFVFSCLPWSRLGFPMTYALVVLPIHAGVFRFC